jgi:hypothetical protein
VMLVMLYFRLFLVGYESPAVPTQVLCHGRRVVTCAAVTEK